MHRTLNECELALVNGRAARLECQNRIRQLEDMEMTAERQGELTNLRFAEAQWDDKVKGMFSAVERMKAEPTKRQAIVNEDTFLWSGTVRMSSR